jgi:hypothetical protein
MGHRCVAIAFAAWSALLAGCGVALQEQDGAAVEHPEFLTPVAQVREAGVVLYWLGEEFEAGSLLFQIAGSGQVISRTGGTPGLSLNYNAETERGGTVGVDVESYPAASGEPSAARDAAMEVRGATSKRVEVGPWPGELFMLPAGTRPVNQIWVFIDLGPTIVVAQVSSVSTGVPGTDSNPLLEEDLLLFTLAANLRPYPE